MVLFWSSNALVIFSGLTEGDHIIYIDTRNIQAVRTFDEMTLLIQRIFEETGQVTLVTLTAPAYQVLKRKGGYLQPEPFDYQLPFVRELSPRLCKILLYNHEQDFGFTLQRGNPIHIKDVHPGSPAYEHGLRSSDKILELNGRDTVSLSSEQIIEIIEASKRRRQLDILVIDTAGYEFSVKHAIPLNSFLPFVQPGQRRGKFFFVVPHRSNVVRELTLWFCLSLSLLRALCSVIQHEHYFQQYPSRFGLTEHSLY